MAHRLDFLPLLRMSHATAVFVYVRRTAVSVYTCACVYMQ